MRRKSRSTVEFESFIWWFLLSTRIRRSSVLGLWYKWRQMGQQLCSCLDLYLCFMQYRGWRWEWFILNIDNSFLHNIHTILGVHQLWDQWDCLYFRIFLKDEFFFWRPIHSWDSGKRNLLLTFIKLHPNHLSLARVVGSNIAGC